MAQKLRVVIVGAGAAGIAAAARLLKSGAEVTVLEAADRLGGRMHSVTLGDGTIVDLGANWIEGDGTNSRGEPNPFSVLAQEAGADVGGFRGSDELYGPDGKAYPGSVRRTARTLYGNAWDHAMEKVRGLPGGEDISVQAAFDQGLEGSVSEITPEVRAMLDHICSGSEQYYGGPLNEMSLRLYGQESSFDGPETFVRSGYGNILLHHARVSGVAEHVRLQHVVKRIAYEAGSATVFAVGPNGQQCVLPCDHVIVTVSIGVLKAGAIEFDPPLPDPKIACIRQIGSGLMDKVILRFDRRFWPKSLTHWSYCLPERGAWRWLLAFPNSAVILCLLGCNFARRVEATPDEAVVAELVSLLRLTFLRPGQKEPVVEEARITRWGTNPLTLGSYSFIAVGGTLTDFDVLAEPVGTLHFAGEATSREDFASAHGAYLSGLRAADEVVAPLQP